MSVEVVTDVTNLLHGVGEPESRLVLGAVSRCRAMLSGHFRLQNGSHSEYFLRFAQIGRDEDTCRAIGEALAAVVRQGEATPSRRVVLCPESAGFFLGRAVAQALDAELSIAMVDLRRCPVDRVRSGRTPMPGDHVILVNDVVVSAGSFDALYSLAERSGAIVEAALAFVTLAPGTFAQWGQRRGLKARHLAVGTWSQYPQGEGCPRCATSDSIIPSTEFN